MRWRGTPLTRSTLDSAPTSPRRGVGGEPNVGIEEDEVRRIDESAQHVAGVLLAGPARRQRRRGGEPQPRVGFRPSGSQWQRVASVE